ncbi:TIGR04053 family radical SAM/SPASM domain-containing protein [Sporosarcina pasteurii]|uniref:Pyrroloquinoline quinone biosynthesis protein PqqE n=1 Tax=Sporosarcina pasteurii TaxID=1474 RepID=A0A380BDC4_SPOPA|nr:TIGR04053 family radical SAM/SPASM domain-containing protein [Sporosarcina pasteurii]MDS9472542.1 TIGR04053 family radical SAM/SPASM domain-containing protein [Sporosarcina pasteurii]QBQ06095.1 radical SAM/SPASM domain-containing protein [Sporosarcina pasteurii]SUI99461.1 pyrroloquinoline quinone biosynthesis protein PqqE [Sporosarcina pasteurii]
MFNLNKERDFNVHPFIVIWEVTRACALKCLHCRAEAQYEADPYQLSFEEGKHLIDQIAEMDNPLFVFTGGDPLMRPDLFELAKYSIEEKGLPVSMTPSATPKVTRNAILKAKEVGLSRWAFSLDGSCAEIHDHFRGTRGSFDRTMKGIEYLKEAGIPIQVNTTISKYNLHDLEAIAEKVKEMGAVLWSTFFLVPTGRGMQKDMVSAEEHEEVMKWLYQVQQRMPYGVKTTEAPHYRRVYLQERKRLGEEEILKRPDILGRAPQPVNDGDGFVFISHTGAVYPSGFLPIACGNIREQSLADIYQNSPVMKDLRDKSKLKGKCGVCEFKNICGGSRSRAYAVTGDYLESDPYCAYIPKALRV